MIISEQWQQYMKEVPGWMSVYLEKEGVRFIGLYHTQYGWARIEDGAGNRVEEIIIASYGDPYFTEQNFVEHGYTVLEVGHHKYTITLEETDLLQILNSLWYVTELDFMPDKEKTLKVLKKIQKQFEEQQ